MDFTFESLKKYLLSFDVITFDVFDTLITRTILHPSDLFQMVEIQAAAQGVEAAGFADKRREAEALAYEQYGDGADFSQIYAVLQNRFSFSEAQCRFLMELEYDTELQVVIPRKSMRALFQSLVSAGKRLILCSDMYFDSRKIQALLTKCGYPDHLEIFVSSEQGGTKCTGHLFEKLTETLPRSSRTVHVGDNPHSDHRVLQKMHRDSVLIPSGFQRFAESPLYDYLSCYEEKGPGTSLILGYLVNQALFNSPFSEDKTENEAVSVWGGGAFACFMDDLVQKRDDSRLLFVTREGYLLKKMYEQYCRSLHTEPQKNTLFYASRTAAVAASVTDSETLGDAMRQPAFRGTLREFLHGRLNFDPGEENPVLEEEIQLPEQKAEVFRKLKPWLEAVFRNGQQQKKAYRSYTESLRNPGEKLTVVDVGYNGTIQYALSRILGEPAGGRYLFLNDGSYPSRMGCPCDSLAVPQSGVHPLYENLMFLEAVMQVPYGQLQKMDWKDQKPRPVFNADANFSPQIVKAQESFLGFISWFGSWKRRLGEGLQPDFSLAEAIWILLLKFRYLPEDLLDSFWLADGYCGTPLWKYEKDTQCWVGKQEKTPLDFQLLKAGEHLQPKERLKRFVKSHIPYYLYDWASGIWMNYIKEQK